MGSIGRVATLVVGLAGGTFFSQAPEFAQQYRQRIGGAIDELKIIVDDFTKQAADHHLDRRQALDIYARSPDDFLRDRGLSMCRTLERYERLVTQQSNLGAASLIAKPFVLLRDADEGIIANGTTSCQACPSASQVSSGQRSDLSAYGSWRRCLGRAQSAPCGGGRVIVEKKW
ncbi:DUF2937 family protein [Rhizobium sp. BK418]|nr:DUF2937 family protein [Rhizobium sp. BK418]